MEYGQHFALKDGLRFLLESIFQSKNAVTFPPLRGGKVLAALADRLAMKGIQGIRFHSRRAAAPSSSPAETQADPS